jgi:lipid A disaccharide synthetase
MANLIVGEKGITELIQQDANAEQIATEVHRYLGNPGKITALKDFLEKVSQRLGQPGASERAAKEILKYFQKDNAKAT